MCGENKTGRPSRRDVLTAVGTTVVASGLTTGRSDGNHSDLPGETEAFGHPSVERYRDRRIFRSALEKHSGSLLRAMHADGYVDSPSLTEEALRTASDGLVGVSTEGEYGAWFRDGEPKLLVKLPSESHEVVLHVQPVTGERFAGLDDVALLTSVRTTDDGGLTTTGCDVCRSYVECTDTPCETCTCQACIEYGERIAREEFCCCSACGCTDCGYLAEEYCSSNCCNACEDQC